MAELAVIKKEILYVIAVISNPRQFKRRYELYFKFAERLHKTPGVRLYTVEIAFGDRPFAVTQSNNPHHIQLRTKHEIWHKENMINIGVSHLPPDWKYVAWIDADVQFINENWVTDTIHALQHYPIVQMFQTCADTGPEGQIIAVWKSFAWQYRRKAPFGAKGYEFWHPGYAWACTKKAWDAMGGLIDYAILGAADHHMALAWIGKWEKSVPGKVSDEYSKRIKAFQDFCDPTIKRNLGYVKGSIIHFWHGKKKDRKYIERWEVILNHKFNPLTDIKKDHQGLYIWAGNKPMLEQDVADYFVQRNEDSIDE
jgi:hypothetical protein